MIAGATALALARPEPPEGLYHLTAGGRTSWHGFAKAILDAQGWKGGVEAITTADYPLPAKRPANSVLDGAKLAQDANLRLPDWSASLALCLADI